MKLAYIMRGIPGSGKSTAAEKIHLQHKSSPDYDFSAIVSADDYFMVNGKYTFDPSKLGEAHKACLLQFMQLAQNPYVRQLIVDNTNLNIEEAAPYVAIAEAHGFTVQIMQVHCDPELASRRNIHGVPPGRITGDMYRRFKSTKLPSRWQVVNIQGVNRDEEAEGEQNNGSEALAQAGSAAGSAARTAV